MPGKDADIITPIFNAGKGIYRALTGNNAATAQQTATQNENSAAYNDLNQSQRDIDMWARVAEGRNNQGTPMPNTGPAPSQIMGMTNPPQELGTIGPGGDMNPTPPQADLAGAAGSGLAGGAAAGQQAPPGMLSQLGQFAGTPGGGAAIGAGLGGLYGALSGPKDEEDRRSWLQRALMPGLVGGGLGAAAGYGMNMMNEGAKAAAAMPSDEQLGASFEAGFNQFIQQAGLTKEAEAQVRQAFEYADIESIQALTDAYRHRLVTTG